MGIITSRLIPRNARRAMNPVRTVKNAVIPKPVKRVRNAARKVTNPIDTLLWAATEPLTKKSKRRQRRRVSKLKKSVPSAQVEQVAYPAGWYPLPGNVLRWWDGARWTEHTHPRESDEP